MTTPNDTTKQCNKCKLEFPATLEYFHHDKRRGNGLHNTCKECRCKNANERRALKALDPEWREHHNKRHLEYSKEYFADEEKYQKELARLRDYKREKRNDPVYKAEEAKKRHERRATDIEYRNRMRVNENNRHVRELNAEGECSSGDVALQYKTQNGLCWWCGKILGDEYDIDHRIPLARGGTNWPNNIVCSCIRCNRSKGKKMSWEWNGRLL